MIVDISIGLVLFIFLVKGFRSGFLPSLFALLGYIVGGFLGLLGAREVTSEWVGIWSVVGLHLLLIFIGAKIGQTIFRSIGKGVRGFVGPLKFLDSALGAGGLCFSARAFASPALEQSPAPASRMMRDPSPSRAANTGRPAAR